MVLLPLCLLRPKVGVQELFLVKGLVVGLGLRGRRDVYRNIKFMIVMQYNLMILLPLIRGRRWRDGGASIFHGEHTVGRFRFLLFFYDAFGSSVFPVSKRIVSKRFRPAEADFSSVLFL